MQVPPRWQIFSILTLGVIAVSITAIFIRLAIAAAGVNGVGFSLFLAASRLGLAAIILIPAWQKLIQLRRSPQAYYYAIGAGICLAFHFAVWIASLSFTSIAASTALVTTNPIWVSLLAWWWLKEKLTQLTILGIFIALIGGIFIALGDGNNTTQTNPLLGNFLALAGAWMVSLYLLLGREAQRQGLSLGNYIVIAYTVGALVLFPLPFLFNHGYVGYPFPVYFYVFLMAIFSQLIGHSSFNWAVRWISPTIVTLSILFEPIGASFLAYLIFHEVPSPFVLVGGLILLVGVGTAILGKISP